ncbi:amidohydrolase [Natronosporangium hydrolyticum]|uniref:Amidohydrolase n=1 Tax=Natronosporangium hydrolyticum TaxID=2811111 RepID=A0A895YHD0_9ACTN|nr:amidohydrolase [Natronosporangium hydrolyticum]QSB15492.1 amidohydrolase [Natronosporangium hydrolyticum]
MSALTVPESQLAAPAHGPAVARPETPVAAQPLPGGLDQWLAERHGELIAVRRHLHAHPELSHQEFETTALVAGELRVAGLTPRLLPSGNGVICDIGEGGPVVALRADMDALPIDDPKEVEYRSTVPGVAHACGHDVHTAILLGAGQALARLADAGALPGRVRLVFQPAEEASPSGAPQMIAAGALTDVAAIFGLHCAPRLPTGTVAVRTGPLTAATDIVSVNVSGPGGHTARPHLTVDLVHALSRLVVDVPALLDRRLDPRARVSLVFGSIAAGQAPNAIPATGHARGTVRVLGREAWREAPELITQLMQEVAAATGATASVDYVRGVPPVVNDARATELIAEAARLALGPDEVTEAELSMGGEDFGFYLEQVPGSMIRLGTGIADAAPMDIHQAGFDVDERAINHGVRVMVHTALASLARFTD